MTHTCAISRRVPEFCFSSCHPKHQRAQGMPGAQCARSLACKIKKHTSIVTTVTPVTPGIPRAMVLTVSFALSPVTGLSCHCRQQVTTCQLDASVGASGPHDFAVRLGAVRQKHHHVHRIPLRVRDDRDTPLWGARRPLYKSDLGEARTDLFSAKHWTGGIKQGT